jgi:hypothetical protein
LKTKNFINNFIPQIFFCQIFGKTTEDYAKNINMSVFLFLLQGKTLPTLTGRKKVEVIPTTAQKLG